MWYVFKVYVLPNDVPAVHWVEQALAAKPKGLETIFMGDLNSHLRNPCNKREEELATALAKHGLEDVTRNFTPRKWYRGLGRWMWQMKREGQKLKGIWKYELDIA